MTCAGQIPVISKRGWKAVTTALHEASRGKVEKELTGIVRTSVNSGHIRHEDVA